MALNIGEGSEGTNAQFNRFLIIRHGSIKVCFACATIAHRLNYRNKQINYNHRLPLEELSKMTASLQKYLKSN